MGFNRAEAQAFGQDTPRALPLQILDEASGYLMAMGAAAALHKQQREGGSWHVQVSLAQTGQWLRGLGRIEGGTRVKRPELAPYVEEVASGWGRLGGIRHSAQLARTPALWTRPSVRPGTDAPAW
jgi:crotonobetainyl-CoA:carnitine CoA-transferase CaiB-like acyl-CoA transferase